MLLMILMRFYTHAVDGKWDCILQCGATLLDGDLAADPRAVGTGAVVDACHLHGLRPDLRHARTPSTTPKSSRECIVVHTHCTRRTLDFHITASAV